MGLEAALDEPRLDLHHNRPAGLELVRAHLDPGVRPMVTHPEHANPELPQGCLGRLDPRQPQFRVPRKVIKGGSFLCADSYCLRYRPAARRPQMIDTGMSHIGFRCVRGDTE